MPEKKTLFSSAFDFISRLGVLGAESQLHALSHDGDNDFSMMQIGSIIRNNKDLRASGIKMLIDNGGDVARDVALDFFIESPEYFGLLADKARKGVTPALEKIAEDATCGLVRKMQDGELKDSLLLFSIYENIHVLHERGALPFHTFKDARNSILKKMAEGAEPLPTNVPQQGSPA